MKLNKNTFIKRWITELEKRGFQDIEFDFENRGFKFNNFNILKLGYKKNLANEIINNNIRFYTETGYDDELYVDNLYFNDDHYNFKRVPARVEEITDDIYDLFHVTLFEISEEIKEAYEMGEL